MPTRLTSSRFVGRQGELAGLELAFGEAEGGRAGVVLLGGDSGVGKTRLLAELRSSLKGRGLILTGDSVEQGDGELPYAPLLSALRPLVRAKDPAFDRLSAGSRSRLATLLPSIGTVDRGDAVGSESAQVQLFEALLELLDVLSADRPLLLILEDVHWADRSTRTFCAFLARSMRMERVVLLLSYRTDELHRKHPLRPLLAELDRVDRAQRIELSPFDRTELAEALTDILGEAPDPSLLERMADRTEGNPLFLEELLAAGLDGRGSAPQSLNDAFMLRIERLSPHARAVARAVAVGARLDEATLATVTGMDTAAVYEALREAVAEHVLETCGDEERFSFRHALLREALYDDLLPGERSDLHLRVGQALEAAPAPSCIDDDVERIAQIATHYAAAGDQPAALRATVSAANKALHVYAYADAAGLMERALELWPRVEHAEEVSGIDRLLLAIEAAGTHNLAGNFPRSEQILLGALGLPEAETRPERRAHLLSVLAKVQWKLNRGAEGLATAQEALALLPMECDPYRVALLAWLARTRVLRGQYREAIPDGERALAAAREAELLNVTADVLNTLGMAHIVTGDAEHGEAELREAMTIARAIDDLDGLSTAYCNLADMLNLIGRTAEARAVVEEAMDQTPHQLRRTSGWLRLTRSELAFEAGDWETAGREPDDPINALTGVHLIFRHLRDAELAMGFGDDTRAEALLDAACPLVKVTAEPQWHGLYGSLRGELRRRNGNLEGARKAVTEALGELETCTDDVMRIARVSSTGMAIEADMALRAAALREETDHSEALLRADLHLTRLQAAAQDGGPVEAAWLAVGEAELARANDDASAAALWDQASDAFAGLGRPYCAAIARWRQAEALVLAGDRGAAAEAASAALDTARRLGAGWLTGELESLVARGRLALEPQPGAADPAGGTQSPPAQEQLPFGLTPRELQVLSLLAQGATNRQIGAALYMAEKTASVHVSRILAKLDVQTRTQAAAVAHRMHLATVEAPAPAGTSSS